MSSTISSSILGLERLIEVFNIQKKTFLENPYPSAEVRIDLMKRVEPMLKAYRKKIHKALDHDYCGHPSQSSDLYEILGMFDRAKYNIANVSKWMRPIAREGNVVTQGHSKAYVKYHPKGVVGNMVSWNFPFDISIGPMLDQFSAGNKVIIKPSEHAPACGAILQEMIAEYFDTSEAAVVNGDVELAKHFSSLPWDHLIYTGSGSVGKMVMRAAAQNLVPVTLELGGKCPVIVDSDSIADSTIDKIAGAKAVKRGQMCVNVDYCLVPHSEKDKFIKMLEARLQLIVGNNNGRSHACGIINNNHVSRLQGYIDDAHQKGAKIIKIGFSDLGDTRDFPFYILDNVNNDMLVMQEEIFGPIIPIVSYKSAQEATAYINKGDKPLGLYVFSQNKGFIERILENTHSGGVVINAIALQAAQPALTFGGVGASGMGRHHGVEGFREFSYPRGYFELKGGGTTDWIMPPFSKNTDHLIENVAYAPIIQQVKFALKRLPNILTGKNF
jgi:coniferyl-aldehyde dehydrogenase